MLAIHAVDKVHEGKADSSVLYIPCCPLTEANAEYLVRQRTNFLRGTPGPDFPGGAGESQHVGQPDKTYVEQHGGVEGLRAMGLGKWSAEDKQLTEGEGRMLSKVNEVLGF